MKKITNSKNICVCAYVKKTPKIFCFNFSIFTLSSVRNLYFIKFKYCVTLFLLNWNPGDTWKIFFKDIAYV